MVQLLGLIVSCMLLARDLFSLIGGEDLWKFRNRGIHPVAWSLSRSMFLWHKAFSATVLWKLPCLLFLSNILLYKHSLHCKLCHDWGATVLLTSSSGWNSWSLPWKRACSWVGGELVNHWKECFWTNVHVNLSIDMCQVFMFEICAGWLWWL